MKGIWSASAAAILGLGLGLALATPASARVYVKTHVKPWSYCNKRVVVTDRHRPRLKKTVIVRTCRTNPAPRIVQVPLAPIPRRTVIRTIWEPVIHPAPAPRVYAQPAPPQVYWTEEPAAGPGPWETETYPEPYGTEEYLDPGYGSGTVDYGDPYLNY